MELRQLTYFAKAAELQNFTAAAAALFITQSTLSQQIKQLEDELGLPLFDRIAKRVRLTEAGKAFLPFARKTLKDAEYQNCSVNHIAAGATRTYEGEPMSINVEIIGDALVIQHYVATEYGAHYCRMLSQSDVLSKNGRSKVQVLWELRATKMDDHRCEYTNEIHATATPEFLAFIHEHGISLAQAAAARQAASDLHNQEETPLFAKSIERKALTGSYGI